MFARRSTNGRLCKTKDPFECRGNRNDRFVRHSQCSGEPVHYFMSEP
tara:strand:+ start:329 stop:469 length:141 start_codon:yes stop_codon:yes gene_type:complete